MNIDLTKYDRATRKELGVPKEAFVREVGPNKVEVRIGVTADALATAIDEGHGRWMVETPAGVTFVGGDIAARRLLWEAAASVPSPPAAASRPAPRRVPFDYYNGPDVA